MRHNQVLGAACLTMCTILTTDPAVAGQAPASKPQPMSSSRSFAVPPYVVGATVSLATVPAGKYLVMEHVSVSCVSREPDQLVTKLELRSRVDNAMSQQHFDVRKTGPAENPGGGDVFVADATMRGYADPEQTVTGSISRTRGSQPMHCALTVVGYYEEADTSRSSSSIQ